MEGVKRRFEQASVKESLQQSGFRSADEMLATYAGRASDLEPWLKGAQLNTDRTLRLQYLAGMSLNAIQATTIFDQMLRYRRPLK
jgi:spermidine synthase